MTMMFTAAAVLGGIGLVASAVLVVASKIMAVPTDDRVQKVLEALPGVNCGACGYAGCSDYAAAVVAGAKCNLCVPGKMETAAAVAAIMGSKVDEVADPVAVVKCQGSYDHTGNKYDYKGIPSCAACTMFHGGRSACAYGCLGFGDCVSACKFDALHVENGVARINYDNCTGCGACAAACPKGIIEMIPRGKKPVTLCVNRDRGASVRKACTHGCIACGKCVRTCPSDAILLINNLAHIDPNKCTNCGACVGACPVHAIDLRG